MVFNLPDVILRGILFLFLIIVLGLTGNLRATQDKTNSQINFSIFAAVFGLVLGVFYQAISWVFEFFGIPIILAFLDFFNAVFTFAAATSIAANIHAHSCNNQQFLDNNSISQGSEDRCRKAQASTAFLYFAFFIFLATTVLSVLGLLKNGSFGIAPRRTAKPGVPTLGA